MPAARYESKFKVALYYKIPDVTIAQYKPKFTPNKYKMFKNNQSSYLQQHFSSQSHQNVFRANVLLSDGMTSVRKKQQLVDVANLFLWIKISSVMSLVLCNTT